MAFEGILGMIADGATTYLPGAVLSSVAAGGTPDMAYGVAVLLAVGYGVLAWRSPRSSSSDETSRPDGTRVL